MLDLSFVCIHEHEHFKLAVEGFTVENTELDVRGVSLSTFLAFWLCQHATRGAKLRKFLQPHNLKIDRVSPLYSNVVTIMHKSRYTLVAFITLLNRANGASLADDFDFPLEKDLNLFGVKHLNR